MSTTPLGHIGTRPWAAAGTSMRAVVQDRFGPEPEDVLTPTETDPPVPDRGQALVRVRAASVDRGTWHIMAGLPYPVRLVGFGLRRPRYANPGRSLAGTVVAVGPGVSGLAPGDDVFGIGASTFAEYAVADTGTLARKPAALTFEQAAAVPVSGVTALQAVRDHGHVQAGDRVLVLGASGGAGSFAVQIAKALGAEVTGTASTAKLDLIRSLGADHVLDHTDLDIADGGPRFDVIIDTGGNGRLRHLRRALAPHGRLVIVGGETSGRLLGGSGRQIRATLLSPFVSQTLGTFLSKENAADLTALAELAARGVLTPAVDRTYPLAETAAAIRHLLDGRTRGKVVVSVPVTDAHIPDPRSTS